MPRPRRRSPISGDDGRAGQWPVFRGDALADGVAKSRAAREAGSALEDSPPRMHGFEATAAIVDGVVYVGSLDGNFYAHWI